MSLAQSQKTAPKKRLVYAANDPVFKDTENGCCRAHAGCVCNDNPESSVLCGFASP